MVSRTPPIPASVTANGNPCRDFLQNGNHAGTRTPATCPRQGDQQAPALGGGHHGNKRPCAPCQGASGPRLSGQATVSRRLRSSSRRPDGGRGSRADCQPSSLGRSAALSVAPLALPSPATTAHSPCYS